MTDFILQVNIGVAGMLPRSIQKGKKRPCVSGKAGNERKKGKANTKIANEMLEKRLVYKELVLV